MQKQIIFLLLLITSIGHASVMNSYRLVWDTGKIATFGFGIGYNIFNTNQPHKSPDTRRDQIFGPTIDAEVGIAGYEYSVGIKFGKTLSSSRNTRLITLFAGRSQNWMELKTNIENLHYVFGVRLNRKFIEWALKYHTDFESKKMISIQFGLGE